MSGPKRNPDSLNTVGIVVVGICGAVMVYVTITALQAFYMSDTSDVQTMADYGGNDQAARDHKAKEMGNLTPTDKNRFMSIDDAIDYVIKAPDKSNLLNGDCTQTHATNVPHSGEPETDKTLVGGCKGGKAPPPAATPAPAAGNGSGAGSAAAGSGAGSAAAGSGAGSATTTIAPATTGVTPTGAAGGGGAGAGPSGGAGNGSAKLAPGGHAP